MPLTPIRQASTIIPVQQTSAFFLANHCARELPTRCGLYSVIFANMAACLPAMHETARLHLWNQSTMTKPRHWCSTTDRCSMHRVPARYPGGGAEEQTALAIIIQSSLGHQLRLSFYDCVETIPLDAGGKFEEFIRTCV